MPAIIERNVRALCRNQFFSRPRETILSYEDQSLEIWDIAGAKKQNPSPIGADRKVGMLEIGRYRVVLEAGLSFRSVTGFQSELTVELGPR